MPGVPTRRAALPQRPFAFVARGKGLLDGVHNVPMVFMCNMRFGDYLQTDQTFHNQAAIAWGAVKYAFKSSKGGKKEGGETGQFMKVRMRRRYWADLSPSPG